MTDSKSTYSRITVKDTVGKANLFGQNSVWVAWGGGWEDGFLRRDLYEGF